VSLSPAVTVPSDIVLPVTATVDAMLKEAVVLDDVSAVETAVIDKAIHRTSIKTKSVLAI
jgi:hypothetical protein